MKEISASGTLYKHFFVNIIYSSKRVISMYFNLYFYIYIYILVIQKMIKYNLIVIRYLRLSLIIIIYKYIVNQLELLLFFHIHDKNKIYQI